MLQIATLLWLTTIICPSRRPVFAAFTPVDQRLHSVQAYPLPDKRDFVLFLAAPMVRFAAT